MPAMRRYRLAVCATLVLLVASAAVVGTWLWARQALGEGIARWRAEQVERGYAVDYQGPEFGGFPFALSVSFRDPRVTTPQGVTWQGPPVLGEAKLWDPFTIDLHFPGLHRLNASEQAIREAAGADLPRQVDIAAEDAGGRVVLRRDGKVASAGVDLGSLVLSGPKVETVTLQQLTARLGPLRPAGSDTLEELDLVGEALGVALPAGRGGLLGDRVDRLSFDSTLIGGIPPMFVVYRADGPPDVLLLADTEGGPVTEALLDDTARYVELSGMVERRADLLVFRVDPSTLRRL